MILDFHTHIVRGAIQTDVWSYQGEGHTAEHVIAHHRAHGGGRSVVLPIAPGDCSAKHVDGASWDTDKALIAFEQFGDEIIPFCHVNPLAPDALDQICRYHATGKFYGFGEHKVRLECDHPASLDIYRLCGELGWPVLIHFEYRNYNYNFEAFERVLESCPETNFVGHAQAWWANVSAEVPRDYRAADYTAYPQGPVEPGGLTDRWLTQYPNMYGDLSAGSGLNALTRDREFGKDFVQRHRRKLLWGTDCACQDGRGVRGDGCIRECVAEQSLPLLQDYCESETQYAEITHLNAERLLGL